MRKPLTKANLDPKCDPEVLRPQDEERYVENAYEDILEAELAETEAILDELDKQTKELLGAKPETTNDCDKRRTSARLAATVKIDSCDVHISEFSSDPNHLDNLKASILANTENATDSEVEETTETEESPECLETKSQRHPNTIRKYTAALLAFFSNLEAEYVHRDGSIHTRKIPVFYASREKLISLEQHEFEQLANGNTNFLPRGSLVIDSMTYDSTRQLNKQSNVSSVISMGTLKGQNPYAVTQQAPSPYQISARLNIVTRGMNDALMIAEQVAGSFNPFCSIEMREFDNAEVTPVRVKLEGVTFEPPEQDEFSINEVVTEFTFVIYGNLYRPSSVEYVVDSVNVDTYII